MTIERRVKITACVLVLSVLGTAVTLFLTSRLVADGIRQSQNMSQIVRSVFMCRILMDEFLVTGNKRPLQQWNKQFEDIGRILNTEGMLGSADPKLLEDLKNIYRKTASLAEQTIALRTTEESDEQRKNLETKITVSSGLLYRRLEELAKTAGDLNAALLAGTLNKRTVVQTIIVTSGLLLGIIILVNIFQIRKSVVRPLKLLSIGADRIGAGNFDYVVETKADDEVGNLARAFNTMVEGLREREQEREITIKFLNLVNESRGTKDLIHAATTFFQQQSGCDAVGIRLREGDDYPYSEAQGFPEEFILLETHLCDYDEKGRPRLDDVGNPKLACMCGNVICKQFDPSKSFFTPRGSFWTNSTTDLLATTREEDRQARTRNRCNGEGYESVALIALCSGDERLGLLQLNDKRTGRFTPETIELWERLAEYLGVALAKFKAEEGLREAKEHLEIRVQERTAELDKAMQAITVERQRLYDVLETLPVYVCLLDSDYRMPFANRYFRETFAEPLGRRCHDFLFNLTVPCEICETYTVMKTRAPHHWYWTGPNGRDYDIYDFPFIDADGSMLILEMGIDITERRRAEEALQTASVYNRSLIEASLDPLVTISAEGKITDVNTGTERVTGHSRSELIGTDFADYFTDPSRAREGYQQAFRDGSVRDYELEIRHKNGSLTQVTYNASVYADEYGKIIGLFAAARDISDRKRAEKALQTASVYNRSLIEASLDPLVTISAEGKITDVNTGTERVTGHSRSELIGTDFTDYFTDPSRARAGYQQVFRDGLVRDYELEIRHKDGRLTPVMYNATVYRDESGKVVGIFAAARDITDRKRAEEELTRSNEDLQQFAYVASHDLQEPLRNVASCLQLLEQKYQDKLDAKADQLIHYAVDSAVRMKALIQSLLTYSRIATKGKSLGPVDSDHLTGQTVKNLRSSISEAGAVVTTDALPTVFADDTQLLQVFQNLIQNAIKFRKDEPPKIHVSAVRNKNEWIFSVKDNGIGIESRHLDRIFVIFQRLNKRTEYEGTGIGLAIVKKVVERHHGRVWVESEPGVGTTFYFTLPDKGNFK